jgi:TonB family protein
MSEPAADVLATADPSVPPTAVAKTTESQANSIAATKSQSGAPPAPRLVIRIRIPDGAPLVPLRRRSRRRALPLILVAAAVGLSWLGISMFRTDPTSAPAATEGAPNSEAQSPAPVPAPSEAARAVGDAPLPKPATATATTRSAGVEPKSPERKPVESEVRKQSPRAPSPVNEVIPNVPRSARETIRGTIRVSIRVIVDKEGTVVVATADEPGPSRYFERLATEASKKWTFAPVDSEGQRIMLVRFYFKRDGTTARANTLQ